MNKVTKTYRLDPVTLAQIKKIRENGYNNYAIKLHCNFDSDTEIIEYCIQEIYLQLIKTGEIAHFD